MLKKYLVFSIIILVFNSVGVRLVFSQTQDDKAAKLTEKIKTKVAKIGVGEKSKIRVKLRNQTKIKGYISAIDGDSFTVTDKKTGATTKIEYAQTKEVMRGYGSPRGATIGVIAGLAVAATILLVIFGKRYCNEAAC